MPYHRTLGGMIPLLPEVRTSIIRCPSYRRYVGHQPKCYPDVLCWLAHDGASFDEAIELSRQHARLLELRAAVSMARLRRDQGKRDEARDLLAPVYGWFTGGFDTMDLKEAKALLDELYG